MQALKDEARRRQLDRARAGPLGLARTSLKEFIAFTTPEYRFGWFNEDVCRRLDGFLAAVARRESPRLMLFAPPRHGKSEVVSRKFPAYALGRYPNLGIMAASYGADLSSRVNRDVQRLIDEPAYALLFPETTLAGNSLRAAGGGTWARNNDLFEVVGHKGSYRSAGVGGGITGMGGEILIVDDPVKDAEQASSPTYREKVWNWYRSTLYTRRAPGAGIVLIMTRWNIDDLAGRLLNAMANAGEQWQVARYLAIAEEDEANRDRGEALHPERYDLAALEATRTALGSYAWESLYQQRPVAREGGMFKRRWFGEPVAAAPTSNQVVRGWDLAATEAGGDYTVGVKMSRDHQGVFYIEHVERFRGSALEVKTAIANLAGAANDGKRTTIRLPQDPGQAGKDQAAAHARMLAGWNLVIERETGSKETRASAFAAQCEAGNVKLVAGPWNEPFLEELCLAENTLIVTKEGVIPIRNVRPGDFVVTRQGWRRVKVANLTNETATLCSIQFSNGSSLSCTLNHPILVPGFNFKKAGHLNVGDRLLRYTGAAFSFSGSKHEIHTLCPRGQKAGAAKSRFPYIASFGSKNAGRSPRAITSTIWTKISGTMSLAISNARPHPTTLAITPKNERTSYAYHAVSSFKEWRGGRLRSLARRLAETVNNAVAATILSTTEIVLNAGPRSFLAHPLNAFAASVVQRRSHGERREYCDRNPASNAASFSSRRQARAAFAADLAVSDIHMLPGKHCVYNLEVDDAHEFVANGILVHNCLFPMGAHDDQVDAAAGAFTTLANSPAMVISAEAMRQAGVPMMRRRR